jgi:hypothetical protein
MPLCLIGMEACVGAHHLSRRLKALGHDARLKKPRCGSERRCEKTQARSMDLTGFCLPSDRDGRGMAPSSFGRKRSHGNAEARSIRPPMGRHARPMGN